MWSQAHARPGAFRSLGALLLLCAGSGIGQPAAAVAQPATFTVTAVSQADRVPRIAQSEVQLLVANTATPVTAWSKDDNLFLAILIDDSIARSAASNWNDLRTFIMEQPAAVQIAVGYLRNNTTLLAQDFTANHEAAANALRIPLGRGNPANPWLGTIDFLRRWPQTGPRRSILLITSGVDFFRPVLGPLALSPDVDPLIQRAQTQNTSIWGVFFPSGSHRGRNFNHARNGQNDLGRVSDDTGGEMFALGLGVPVSLRPSFDEIASHLANQYQLTFEMGAARRGNVSVDVRTEADAEFLFPARVWAPASGAR